MPDRPMRHVVEESLRGLGLTDVDLAACHIAYAYADELDAGGDVTKIGPALLSVLESLGATPRARRRVAGATGKGAPDVRRDPLDELEQRRRQRDAG